MLFEKGDKVFFRLLTSFHLTGLVNQFLAVLLVFLLL